MHLHYATLIHVLCFGLQVFEWVKNHGGEPIIPFSGVFESKLADMPEDERDKYCKEVGATSAIDKIVTTGFRAIQLIYFFTAGADEVKCWQIRRHTKAPQVSGYTTMDNNVCIHSRDIPSQLIIWLLCGVVGHSEDSYAVCHALHDAPLGTLRQLLHIHKSLRWLFKLSKKNKNVVYAGRSLIGL